MPMHCIRDLAPAQRWEDAFLSGNGEYGIMVHGDPYAERVVFNHHRFVLPNGTRDAKPPYLADRIEDIRDLVLAGRRAEAGQVLAQGGSLLWTQSFHPGYVMTLDTDAARPVPDYCRETDFTTGEVSVHWAGKARRRAFVSRADGVVVQHLSGGTTVVALTGDLPRRPDDVRYETSAYAVDGVVFLRVRATYPPGLGAFGFEGVTAVLGDATVDGETVTVRGGALLLTKLTRYDLPGWATEQLQAALTALRHYDYDELLSRHVVRHAPVYGRVSLDLAAPAADRELPIGELLARQNADRSTLQPALLERLFHSGRYLLLSSSGVLPPRLTGLWLGGWDAAWSGDFTTDGNLNLQMAAANIGAMPEVTAAYARLIYGQVRDWQANARQVYGARGLLAPGRTDGEHGHLFHYNEDWPWAAWLPGADWLLYPLYEHSLVTGEGLGELTPWLVEAAQFFEDFLTRTDETGHVVFVPSFSAETGPLDETGRPVYAAVNATMDIAAARHAMLTARAVTGSTQWDGLLARLPAYRVDEQGALAEWAWPGYTADEDHRHVSHLYPVWPLHEITPQGTPELAAAAHRALRRRGDENLSAHGSLHRALVAARLHDGGLVYRNMRKIIGNDMFFRSLMSSHNPGLETYNADAAHTLPGVLIEMLVDSQPGVVDLLPSLPAELPRGALRGVSCRGRVRVEALEWAPEVLRVTLRSPVAQDVLVRTPGGDRTVRLAAGEPVTVIFDGDR